MTTVRAKMAASVDVGVEAVIEHQIREVTRDGQEIYAQPLSMSENLTKLAQKIDFSKDESDEKGKPTSESEKEEEKPAITFQPSLWPWDSVRTKLKTALTEMCVLQDVLNVAREKHYLVLDPVSQEAPELRNASFLAAKKRNVSSASAILLNGAERLRKPHLELGLKRGTQDFHYELLRLRQHWRLKKVGNVILGDLSYKSCGSRFGQAGTFEVTKSDEAGIVDLTESPTPPKTPSVLQVTVPSDLEGVAYIQVAIKRLTDHMDLSNVDLRLPTDISGTVPSDAHWQCKLEAAQNVIFCKEVFQQLAREAVKIKSHIPHMVVGNQIFSHLFPGLQLSIALCHNTEKDKKASGRGGFMQSRTHYQYGSWNMPSNSTFSPGRMNQKPDHDHVLEHSLHQLLREMHYNNIYHPMPHPATAVLGMSKRRRMAGPSAASRAELLEMTETETLLEQIIKQAKHAVLRQRAIQVIDQLACEYKDPQIAAHWSNVSCATESLIKINITSQGYESIKTSVMLHIGIESLKAVCNKDGRVFHFSYEEQELQDFLRSQVATHHIMTMQNLSKLLGWTVLSLNSGVGIGDVEPIGNAQTCLLASPTGNRVLSIRSGPTTGIHVYVQSSPWPIEEGSVIKDEKWNELGGPFREVHLDKVNGRNFLHRMEQLMACLCSEIMPSTKETGEKVMDFFSSRHTSALTS